MKWYWKVFIGFCSLVLLLVIVNIGLNLWIKFQLPKIINKENDSAYIITYKNLEVSLLNRNIKAQQLVIVPKAYVRESISKSRIYSKVIAVEVKDFKIWNLLFDDKIQAKSIIIDSPTFVLQQKDREENIQKSVVAPFEKIISVSDIFLNHGDFKIIDIKDSKLILSVQNIDLQLEGVFVTDKILKRKIPFEFRNYAISCDSLFYNPNSFYQIKTNNITASKTSLTILDFKMIPVYSRRDFVSKIVKEKDLYTLLCDSIEVSKMDWGFVSKDFFFHCNTVVLNNAYANIYRSKEPADDLTKKYLYNKLLRDLKFDLKIDTLKIRNSRLDYEEEKSSELGAGKLLFNSFNLTATNISSGFKKEKLSDIKIKINCKFMNTSPLNVNWNFNVMDKSDGFKLNGTLINFDAENIVAFTKPYLNVTTKGMLEEVYFNFSGNDKKNIGEFKVKYDDLKFTIYKKGDHKKKNKLLTFVAKIFVKKDTKDKLKDTHIEVERIPEKSFYNLLWRSIAEGLKKILV